MNIDKIIDIVRNHRLDEMMTVGGGAIAGTVEAGDDPPVKKKRPTILARGKMPGCRKRWKEGTA
jgi:hypothetical protein|tara:strand:+ start:13 stop:204 length:192 start_codon:yes stop_codon:yes gene_type:complete